MHVTTPRSPVIAGQLSARRVKFLAVLRKINAVSVFVIELGRGTADCEDTFLQVMLTREKKEQILTDYRTHESDTGSPQVQVALLTKRINELTDHFKTHKKDNHSRRGLLKMVSQRRSMLEYLKRRDIDEYHALIARLGLRR